MYTTMNEIISIIEEVGNRYDNKEVRKALNEVQHKIFKYENRKFDLFMLDLEKHFKEYRNDEM